MKKRMVCIILTLVLLLGLLPVGTSAAVPYYEKAGTLEANGEYVLAIRDESTVRGGTLFTFAQDGTVEGSYSIKGSGGYLYGTRGALSCTSSTVSAQASWTMTMTEGAVTLQNNTSSKYYLLYSDGAFTVNKTAGDALALYDADGNRLTALPESPFQAYICNADGTKFLSETITADDAEKTVVADYVIKPDFSLESYDLLGLHTRDVGDAALWQFRDGKLYCGQNAGLNAALNPAGAPDAATYSNGKLKIGQSFLNAKNGVLGAGTEADAASVQIWKKLDPPVTEGTYLAITCDIHFKYRADFAIDEGTGEVIGTTESTERMNGWLDQASADFGGVFFDQLVSCGDQGDANTAITGVNYWERVGEAMKAAANHEKVLGGGFFINGNHEWQNGQYNSYKDTNPWAKRIRTGGYVEESDDYVLYSLSASQTNNNFDTADITALDNYLKTAPKKPIFIVSHYPLHNFNRSERNRDTLIDVLNSYADSLQIIFLWGHNHTEEDPNYGIVFNGDNIDASGMDIPHVEFTYCSAGCMTDDEYDVHAVFTKPKGMVAYIAPDQTVSLTYYDVNYEIMSTTILDKPLLVARAALEKAVADAEAIDTAPYTEASAAALAEAIKDAGAVLADEEATAGAIDAAARALDEAVKALEPRADDSFRFEDVNDDTKFYFDPVYWAFKANPQITNGTDATHFGPDNPCTRGHVVTFLWRAAGCPEPTSTETPFKDLKKGAFYEKAVAWAVEKGITNGLSDDRFGPDAQCNRGQIVTFLWRYKGQPAPANEETPFKDLKAGAFYLKAVAWAVENEVTNGLSADKFGPDATCTRGQVVTFLYRAAKD